MDPQALRLNWSLFLKKIWEGDSSVLSTITPGNTVCAWHVLFYSTALYAMLC